MINPFNTIAMTFSELNLSNQLLNALEDLGLTSPTPIQEQVFSTVMAGKDVCAIAQTGTGKTFAYLLPLLRQYKFSKDKNPQFMIIVPTRELVVQIVEEIEKLSKYMSVVAVGVYGGVNMKPQAALVREGLDILVGTPGRIVDLLSVGALNPKTIKKIVIDEFDEMLNLGFRTQLKHIFDRLPQKRQNLLFSATLNPEVEQLIDDYFVDLQRIEAAPVGTPLDNIAQKRYDVPNFYTKLNLLEYLLTQHKDMSKVLVFVSTKHYANLVHEEMSSIWPKNIQVIHSNKGQNNRFAAVEDFHSGKCRVLIATDIIARGLDVSQVTHVVNFDLPDAPENYIHRIGRTGRAEHQGETIALVSEPEQEYLKAIEALMNYQIPVVELPQGLPISTQLLPEEEPKIRMKNIQGKLAMSDDFGGAFHEKSAKNSKVNVRRNHEAEKKKKYGSSYEKRGRKE
jgi:ATP-dependent RNA helicase RhlE